MLFASLLLRHLDTKALHHLLQPESRQAEQLCGARLVAVGLAEGLLNELGLQRIDSGA